MFRDKINNISLESKKVFKEISNLSQVKIDKNNRKGWDDFIEKNKIADKTLIKFLNDAEYTDKSLKNYKKWLSDNATQTSLFSRVTQKASTILKSFGATMASMAIMWAIGTAIGKIVEGIDKVMNSSEYCKERVDNLVSSFQSALNTANSNAKTAESLAVKYEKLSSGVDGLGKNISLTTAEYQEYNDIANQIAEMFPQFIAGYTEEGNAILSLKGNVEELRNAYKEAQAEAYNLLITSGEDANGDDILKNWDRHNQTTWWEQFTDWGKPDIGGLVSVAEAIDTLDQVVNGSYEDWKKFPASSDNANFAFLDKLYGLDENTTEEEFNKLKPVMKAKLQELQAEMFSSLSSVRLLANAFLMTNDDYELLDKETKAAVSKIINNLDGATATGFDGEKENVGAYVAKIVDAVKSSPEIQTALKDLLSLDTSGLNPDEAKEKIDSYLHQIAEALDEDEGQLKINLGFESSDELAEKYHNALQAAADKFDLDFTDFFKTNSINTQEEIDAWLEIANQTNNAAEAMKGYLEIKDKISPVTFEIGDYSERIDSFQSSIGSLKNALDSLNSSSLSENDVLDLMQQFPELIPYIDMAAEGFGSLREGLENLIGASSEDLISQLRETAQTISDPQMLDNINSLINVLSQIAEVKFSWGMDDTIGMIDNTISKMSTLADLSSHVSQNGFVMNSDEAWEYAKIFPEILSNAETYTNGKIKLDEQAVNSAIQGREAEMKADIQAKIQELENEKAIIAAKKAFAQEQLNIINSVSSGDSLASKETALNKIINAQAAVDAMIQGGMDEATAYHVAATSMSNDIDLYNQYVAQASKEIQNNMDTSAAASADSVANNIEVMKGNITGLAADWYNAGLVMINALRGTPTEFKSSGPVSHGISNKIETPGTTKAGNFYDLAHIEPSGGQEITDISAKSKKKNAEYIQNLSQPDEIDAQIEYHKKMLNDQIQGYDKQTNELNAQIDMFNAAYNRGLDTYHAAEQGIDPGSSNSGTNSGAAEKAENLSKELLDHFEQRRHEIEKVAKSLETYMDNVESAAGKNSFADQLISVNQTLLSDLEKTKGMYQAQADQYLAMLPDNFKELAKNGGVSMTEFIGNTSSEIQEAIKNYQEWAHKVDDIDQELIELKETLKQLQAAKFSNIAEEFERFIEIFDSAKGKIDGIIDLLESQGQKVGEGYYQALIDQSRERISLLEEEREQLKKQMDEALANGIELGSDEWEEMYQKLQSIDQEIIGCYTDIENFQTDIDNLHWDTLDAIADRFSQIQDQISGLSGLLDIETATKGAQGTEWTDESLTYLGLQTQAYEAGMYQAAQYAKEIEKLKEDYAAGKYSAAEYYEKLADLESKQWDCVDSANAAKDAIRELNEQRVKEATDAIEKEIDAYSDYIDTLKDALSEEKSLHDYRNSILEKNRNITATAREINALGASGTAADRASLAKLRQQQNENINSLQEAQYQHDLDARQDALDQELEAYKAMKEAEIEALQNSIASTEVLIGMLLTEGEVMIGSTLYKLSDFLDENGVLQEEKLRASLDARYAMYTQTFEDVKNNTDIVMAGIDLIIQQYGLSIDSSITTPWHNGSAAVAGYGADLTAASSLFIQAIQLVEQEQINLQTEANRSTDAMLRAFGVDTSGLVSRVGSVRSALDQSANASQNLAAVTASALSSSYDASGMVNSIYSIRDAANATASAAGRAADAIRRMYDGTRDYFEYTKNNRAYLIGGGNSNVTYPGVPVAFRYAKGGVVTGTTDQWLRKELGEDTLAAVRMGERILTPEQNRHFEDLVRLLPHLTPEIAGMLQPNFSPVLPVPKTSLTGVPSIHIGRIDAGLIVQGSVDKTFASQLESAQKDTVNKVTGAIARQLGRVGFRTNAYDMQKI